MVDGGASDSEGSDISGIILTAKRMDLDTCSPGVAVRRPWPGTVPGCQICLASRTKHDLKALTPIG